MYCSEIVGVGGYVPEKIVSNEDLEGIVATTDQWITTRTGIVERRISTGEKTNHMAVKAAIKAIKHAEIDIKEIDLVILATITPDFFTPSTANLVQGELGLRDITSFDISAGCTGFIYGIQIADQFIKTGKSQCALVIGAEILSKVLDWHDRNTCVLFGDGAGAVILKRSSREGIICTYTGSRGDLEGLLKVPAISLKNPFFTNDLISENHSYIYMNGKEIFKFATNIMLKSIEKVLSQNKLSIDEIDYIIPHQANYRIIDYVAKKIKASPGKFYKNMDHFGNTSAASIPLALDEMIAKGIIQDGHRIIMVGFGGGLTWGSILFNWTR
ncbi:MAG: ketoacyl-ACP synthase III [Atribacterota bacterium]|nr:ketoacyl-ACP synthase III [Atribacterota bacterium]MDD4895754.1 ketoacyl-ACP synthase III [Atribacterota bacterium]MDD5636751.1 ketoacyl-ACP synthase III [Atribacterota bacterium]